MCPQVDRSDGWPPVRASARITESRLQTGSPSLALCAGPSPKDAAATAGTVAGAMSGAKLLSGVIPVPFVGPVVGAVVGGVIGSEVGRRLGKAVIDGGSTFVKTLTSPSS